MVARIRDWCRSESLGIVLPSGLVALWVIWQLIEIATGTLVFPLLTELADGDAFDDDFGLHFTLFGVGFQPDTLFSSVIAATVFGWFLWWLFWRPIPEDIEPDPDMRECPECLSEILADARRCAFCTATVTPVPDERQVDGE